MFTPFSHIISCFLIIIISKLSTSERESPALYLNPDMGNFLAAASPSMALPIETMFKLPSPLPTWSEGGHFAAGTINLGGLEVTQFSNFTKIWATREGGPDNKGATFFEPSSIPDGFSMLGSYSQANNKPLFGWVLVAKDSGNDLTGGGNALEKPLDYTLVWSSASAKIKQDGIGYIWIPVPPAGYNAVGHMVTNSPEKPPLDKVRCVRSDLTDQCEHDTLIWGQARAGQTSGINVYFLRPMTRGPQARGVCSGTFIAEVDGVASQTLSCLKNGDSNSAWNFLWMPDYEQLEEMIQAYSPWIYLHPDERYLPSSVSWFFDNGCLLYKQGDENNPVPINPDESNLPLDGSNDGTYWLDLPVDQAEKERVKKGDLQSADAYIHVKPMLGGTFTDLAIWVFYPFNGPARAKVGIINAIPLGKIGEHVGDWEHITLRVSNFNGELWRVYFSEHSAGTWVDASELEFQGGNKPVSYASLNGHGFYSKPGLVLQGNTTLQIGIRNDCAKSKTVMDTGARYDIVSADYLGKIVVEPLWLNYLRKWGPKISYDINQELKKVEKFLPGNLKKELEKIVKSLPNEILGEDGPTGPKVKNSWNGDEPV